MPVPFGQGKELPFVHRLAPGEWRKAVRQGTLGIDVGKTGAIGLLDMTGAYVDIFDMPYVKNDVDLAAIEEWCSADRGIKVCAIALERQQARPAPGPPCPVCHRAPHQGASSTFNLGVSYGMLLGWCYRVSAQSGAKLYVPMPSVWKRQVNLPADKEETRLRALREFPGAPLRYKKHHGRAESLFLAEYARLQFLRR